MDSPVLNQLFRQLFRRPACQSLRHSSVPTPSSSGRRAAAGVRLSGPSRQQSRSFLTRRTQTKRKNVNDGLIWHRIGDYPKDIDQELRTYPLVTAKDLRSRKERPRQVKILTREFIDGKLALFEYELCGTNLYALFRQFIQPPLRLLFKACDHFQSRGAV